MFMLSSDQSPAGESVLLLGANVPLLVARGELYRLIASCFLHADIWHLALNSYWIWLLGRMARDILGSGKFLTLYIFSGLVGALVSTAWRGRALLYGGELTDMAFMGLGVGASGAGMGIMGFLLAWLRKSQDMAARSFRGQLLFWLGFNIIYGLTSSHIDNSAHFGGLVMGFLMGSAMQRGRLTSIRQFLSSQRTTAAAAALMIAGIGVGNLAPYLSSSDDFRDALALSPAIGEIVALEKTRGFGRAWKNDEKRDARHLTKNLADLRPRVPSRKWSAVADYAEDLSRDSRGQRVDPEQHAMHREAFHAYARSVFLKLAPCSGLMWKGNPRELLKD